MPLIETMHFSRQMSTFIHAGIPIIEALDTLRVDMKSKRFQSVLEDVVEKVGNGGASLADHDRPRGRVPQLLHGHAPIRRAHRQNGRCLRAAAPLHPA